MVPISAGYNKNKKGRGNKKKTYYGCLESEGINIKESSVWPTIDTFTFQLLLAIVSRPSNRYQSYKNLLKKRIW